MKPLPEFHEGTYANCQKHYARGTIPCTACKEARKRYQYTLRKKDPKKQIQMRKDWKTNHPETVLKMKLSQKESHRILLAEIRSFKVLMGCTDCGYNTHPEALDFDHIGPKNFNIGRAVAGHKSRHEISLEIDKCEVVCANCHRVRTSNRRG